MANRPKLAVPHFIFVIVFINCCPGANCETPTVYPAPNFNSTADAFYLESVLRHLDRIGDVRANEKIGDLLARRSWAQRREIVKSYESFNRTDLVEDLKELDDFDITDGLLSSLPDYYAKILHDKTLSRRSSLMQIHNRADAIIEVFCPHKNLTIIYQILESYRKLSANESSYIYRVDDFMKSITSALCIENRYEAKEINETIAAFNARNLIEVGMKKGLARYLLNQNPEGIRQISREYKKLSGRDLLATVTEELTNGTLLEYLIIKIVSCIISTVEYFAEKLYSSRYTDPASFIRILITRSETDLGDIAETFQNLYRQPLVAFVGGPGIPGYLKSLLSPPESDKNWDIHSEDIIRLD